MKCKNCGGEIRLEELYCPYCGSPNEEAQRHARDMQHYQQQFRQTREDVIEKAGTQTRRAVRIAAAAILLVLIGVNIFLQANSYSLHRMWDQSRQKKYIPAYQEKLEEYLEAEDYLGFAAFWSNRDLSWSGEAFDGYYPIYRMASQYRYAVESVMNLINHSSFDNVDRLKKYVSEEIQSFYESLDPENYLYNDSYDTPGMKQHIEQMTEQMEALCIAYLNMTPEEARSLRTLSRGGRILLIERGLEMYTGEEEGES